MRFGIAVPNYGPLAVPDTLVTLARHAEDLGVESIWVSDHLVAPVGVQSIYPYDRRPDAKPGDMGVIEYFYEPIVTLAYLAGLTTRVRLGVSAYIMPYRNPCSPRSTWRRSMRCPAGGWCWLSGPAGCAKSSTR